jgi:CBS domain containing-hemolysin-like protein
MTPLNNVVLLPADMIVKDAFATFQNRAFSRIPLHSPDNQSLWTGLVMSRDILVELAKNHDNVNLGSIARQLFCVSGDTRGHVLLDAFLKRRSHLFGVQSEDKKMIGVVSLEDVMEEILGAEISDEREAMETGK